MRTAVNRTIGAAFFCLLAVAGAAAGAAEARRENVKFIAGGEVTLRGDIKGREFIDYVVRIEPGQTLKVRMKATNRLAQFMVLPPNSDEALFTGETYGAKFEQRLTKGGEYRVRIALVRAAARRNEDCNYVLDIEVPGAGLVNAPATTTGFGSAGGAYANTLSLEGISFFVTSPNSARDNSVTATPSGLEGSNLPVSASVEGMVTGSVVADINGDKSPEIYVFVAAPAPDARVSLLAYSANKRKSLSQINLPTLDAQAAKGYLGHDKFVPVDGMLVRSFPVFGKGGNMAVPTGLTRQLHYVLEPGEASWQLRLQQVFDY